MNLISNILPKLRRCVVQICLLLLAVFSIISKASAQNDTFHDHEIDSAMAYSPDYLPTRAAVFPDFHHFPLLYQSIDTLLLHVSEYDPLWKTTNLYQSLGINGQAHKPMLFSLSRPDGFSMIHLPYPLYFKEIKDLKVYDLATSYSDIFFYYGILDELAIRATHAQRIRNFNYSVDIEGLTNSGYFIRQGVKRLNVDGVARYETPNKKYGFILSYILNTNKLAENGGLENGADFTDRNARDTNITNVLSSFPVKFSNGNTTMNTHNARLTNYVNFHNKKGFHIGTLSHTVDFNYLKSMFTDYDLNDLFYAGRYYASSDSTNDSLKFFSISNSVQWANYSPLDTFGSQSYYVRYAAGLRHEYVNAISPHYAGNHLAVFGRVSLRLFKVWDIYGKMSYSFFGYTHNDASATIGATFAINRKQKHHLNFEASFDRYSPDYFFTSYSGNNNLWDNVFKKQNVLNVRVNWTIFGYSLGFSFYNLGKYVYMDNNFQPLQFDKQVQVLQITAYAPVRTKHFVLDAFAALQHSTNKCVSVPLFAGKVSAAYVTKIFRKRLNFEVGVDLMYNTNYYSDAYNPLLHQFYSQQYVKTGNYLFVNAHLALRVKRISVFVRGGNLIAGLLSFRYITTPAYPMQGRNFEVGISWKFYD